MGRSTASPRTRAATFALLGCALVACGDGAPGAPPPPATGGAPKLARSDAKVALFEVPAGTTDGAAYMRGQLSKLEAEAAATGKRKTAIVYVGAPWCEPCVRFHDAVKRGELDAELAGAVLFEFDHDRDEATLAEMGCTSRLVPLFAVATADGRCGPQRTEGGIKGEGAVAFLAPKVRALLD